MELNPTDKDLVHLFQAGNIPAYEDLISRYTEKVYRLAFRITRNSEDAEEILQDVCISVFQKINSFEGKSAFSSWLYRITANASLMKLRQRKKHSSLELDEKILTEQDNWTYQRSDTCDVEYMSIRHELRIRLKKAIQSLPEDYKAIFMLRDVDGLSNIEIAELLNLSVAAVKSRLHRSRLLLRQELVDFQTSDEASTFQIMENDYSA